jgi:DNA repair exonuclease SbcCD ATPase subunit/DNA repair exonuclease SbcCD nuclease subunit
MVCDTIIHIADLHLRRGAARFIVYRQTIDNLLAAIDGVSGDKIIAVCGDIFHDRHVLDAYIVQLFARLMRGLVTRGKVIFLAGNHDMHPQHADTDAPYDVLGALLTLFGMEEAVLYVSETGHHVVGGVGVGVVTVHDVSAEGDVRSNHLKSVLPPFPLPDTGCKINVALYHGTLTSCRSRAGSHIEQHGVALDWFAGYDAALLGDIHLQQVGNHVVDEGGVMRFERGRTAWAYPGSLVQQDHGEQLWGHGMVVWDLVERSITPIHVKCPHGYLTVDKDTVLYDMRWTPLQKHLADPDFPSSVCVRAVGDADPTAAVDALIAKGVLVESVAGARRVPSSPSGGRKALEGCEAALEGRGALESTGLDVEAVVRTASFPTFENAQLDSLARDRSAKLDKLLTRFRDVKGTTGVRLEVGLLSWSWILSFPADNSTRMFGDPGVTVLHAPNGAGKTALLETLYIAMYGEGFPSRSPKEDATSFINDRKPKDALASTALEFRLGGDAYMVVRRWQNLNGKGVCKAAILKRVSVGGRVVDLHKGKLEVDKWIAANVCTQADFLAGVLLSQAQDGDFLGMTPKEQGAIMNRAFGLDAIDALYDFLHEARNSMLYVLNQVPEFSSTASLGTESRALRDACDIARRQDAEARRGLEMLPPPAASPQPCEIAAAKALILEMGSEDIETRLATVSSKLARVAHIQLPRKYAADVAEYEGSFEDAKREVDAAVRFESECARHEWTFKELWGTADEDSRLAVRADLAAVQRGADESARTVQIAKRTLEATDTDLTRTHLEAVSLKEEVERAGRYERVRGARSLNAAAERARPAWSANTRAVQRLTVLMEYIMTPGAPLLPSVAAMVQALGGLEDRPILLLPTFDACLEALGSQAPKVEVTVRQAPPKYGESEAVSLLMGAVCREADLEGRREHHAVSLARARDAASMSARGLKEALHEDAKHGTHRRRSEAFASMKSARQGFTAQTDAAIGKFRKERSRLEDKVKLLREVQHAQRLLASVATEARRSDLKAAIEDANLMEITKLLGRAEAVEEWTKDEGAIAECRRRLGVVMHALATLTELKATTYAESILPRLCEEVNALIASVDPSLGVRAVTTDGGGVKWYATVFGQSVRIRRASGFQRDMIALGVRIVLGQMIRPCGCVLIDEGFTSCDGAHIAKIPAFLKGMISSGRLDTVVIVTHISTLQDGVDHSVGLRKGAQVCL